MTQPAPPFAAPRVEPRADGDFTLGCGQPKAGVVNGRVCAGTGTQLSCKLCPSSPTYWRNEPAGGGGR